MDFILDLCGCDDCRHFLINFNYRPCAAARRRFDLFFDIKTMRTMMMIKPTMAAPAAMSARAQVSMLD